MTDNTDTSRGIPVKTLTATENERLLTRAFCAQFAKEVMREEKRLGIKRPTAPAVIEF